MPWQDNRDPKKSRNSERDDFWDIDRLMPDRGKNSPPRRPRPTPSAVDVEVPSRAASGDMQPTGNDAVRSVPLTVTPPACRVVSEPALAPSPSKQTISAPSDDATVHYVPPHSAGEAEEVPPLLDYRPVGVLLHRVQVYPWTSGFHYFDQFAKEAAAYAQRSAPSSAAREKFFSYFPQYVQLNRRQSAWYLWWREQVRAGVYPDTDYAYVLLYLFELINLDAEDDETARKHCHLMASVWMAYRRTYPQLDRYMCEWLCDYCLIHALPAPLELLSPALDDIIAGSRLKEFYLMGVIVPVNERGGGEEGRQDRRNLITTRILMRHCCQYDYRKSKFAGGEHQELFDKTIPAAIAAVLPFLLGTDDRPPTITMQDSTVTRDAFTGALCSYRFKRKIKVSYTSFSRSHDLRFLIGDMVKHVENRLRGWIGVRSRLSVMSLPPPLRDALDAYLAPLAPHRSPAPTKKKEIPRPEYEALYDLPEKPLSIEDAAAIEADSWETTRILTEAFSGNEECGIQNEENSEFEIRNSELENGAASMSWQREEAPAIPPASAEDVHGIPPATDAIPHSPLAAALGDLMPFLRAALDGDRAAQRAYAAAHRKMPDAIADEINAITAEIEIFDMVLEDDGSGSYAVIEDYRAILQSI